MLSDIEISHTTELKPIAAIAHRAGLHDNEFNAIGAHKAKVDAQAVLKRFDDQHDGKFILVTAVTPTPLGEGKTVTTIGLSQGLQTLGRSVMTCIRQPSMGPVFGVKGGAAGGGYSQVAPMDELNLHLTGDIHAVTAAHNLASAAIDARLYHEQRDGYEAFEARTGLKALRIDPNHVVWKRVIDHNDRALRMVTVGLNEPNKSVNGYVRQDGFDISAASELMAILALATDLHDMRKRIGRIVVAYDFDHNPITAEDLQVAGAMTVVLKDAINPTLMQSLEGVPTLIHAGPFANIAHGNSSIIADRVALKLADYVVTEAGFGSDMGFEKACNIKAAVSNHAPDCVVLVATLRSLKANSGLYDLRPGAALPDSLVTENHAALKAGFANLEWHINNIKKYQLPVVVALNRFPQDSDSEIAQLGQWIHELDPEIGFAQSEAFAKGGIGTQALAQAVLKACEQPHNFTPLYTTEMGLLEKLTAVATRGYGAQALHLSELAQQQLARFDALGFGSSSVCIAKTPLSISANAALKGAPKAFDLDIRELKLCAGAGFIYALTGDVMTMPGLSDKPAFMALDIDANGQIIGLS
ncbi:formate--tetrahydrofolate ligase [Vibrio sp. SM6]|uniref:Formate--tetrahydrofolate ligase n=1 Tax=Vibrio agarilyticus TaxID=2726741 RepID=A0A7X8TR92_9VIBR|nr:formate--tetrahydrofolate ligase [Vibrio agarilyticus]NLS13415.1 formate--tetrahydrofolate ligase [Vibrio agarilyticus]